MDTLNLHSNFDNLLDRGRVRRDGAVHAAYGLGRDVHCPIMRHCRTAQGAQRIGRDLQPFERGGEHRPRARFELRQHVAQQAVMLEDARNYVRQPQGEKHQHQENRHAPPAAAAPYQPQDQCIERQPHRRARDGEHHAVEGRAAVEIEGHEQAVVESIHGSMDLS